MQLFYSTMTELNFFTLSVNSLLFNQPCLHCHCSDQWVSHGFNYNQAGQVRGKRIVCCARFGKRGCGRTILLYLSHVLPKRRYLLITLFQFIQSLINGNTVEAAYINAVGHIHHCHRQAYRWLSSLYAKLGDFRVCLGQHSSPVNIVPHRTSQLSSLISTLKVMVSHFPDLSVFQQKINQVFC